MIERRRVFLIEYQDQRLADKFSDLVRRTQQLEMEISSDDSTPLTEALARSYFKLLAYKDEYEVARLHVASGFSRKLKNQYGKHARLRFHLAPPLISRKKDARGRPLKREFGAWIIPLFGLLAKMRWLRGSRLDLFGRTAERRMERELIVEFERLADQLLSDLNAASVNSAVDIVRLYMDIRGFGPVKEQAAADVRKKVGDLLAAFSRHSRQAA
jgi:indolepyruvate ferredoxin oxidoreductase